MANPALQVEFQVLMESRTSQTGVRCIIFGSILEQKIDQISKMPLVKLSKYVVLIQLYREEAKSIQTRSGET